MAEAEGKYNYSDFRNQGDRRSMQSGSDLASIYAKGEGSIYTKGGPPSPNGTAQGLQQQIDAGNNFFGYGRNKRSSGLNGKGIEESSAINVAGSGTAKSTGNYDLIQGFVTKKKPMGDSDYGGGDHTAVKNCVTASWYTTGLEGSIPKYGDNFKMRGLSKRHGGAKSSSDGSGR